MVQDSNLTHTIRTALERVSEAAEISERETLSVGQLVGTIMQVSQRQRANLEESLNQFSDASKGSVRHVAAAQSEATAQYLAEISSLIDEQLEVAGLAALQCEQISKAGATIEQATIEARILSLNARITAAQSNSDSAAFAAIASEMQALSQTVGQANALVGELATKLNSQLPQIAAQAAAMREENQRFSGVLNDHIRRVEQTTRGLEDALKTTISTGSQHYAEILKASQRALSHLQYQDPMVQRLRRTCLDLRLVMEDGADGADGAAPLPQEPMAPEADADADGDRVSDAQDRPEAEDDEQAENAGEVLLF